MSPARCLQPHAAAIDATLAALARSLGTADPRTEQQRRADLFADLLLGRLTYDEPEADDTTPKDARRVGVAGSRRHRPRYSRTPGTHLQRIDDDGEPIGEQADAVTHRPLCQAPKVVNRPQKLRIGVVVPLASLLGATNAPGELADRSGPIPGEVLKEQIAKAIDSNGRDEALFTRLLTDDGGRLLDTTELGRHASARLAQAIKVRAGTCRHPTARYRPTAATLIITNHGPTARHRPPTWIRCAGDTTE
jgi:hypothetical protein